MSTTSDTVAGDVIVVGGGAGGLTAALVLARARHRIVLIDDQTHRNATVDEFHGFPARDATAPERFRSDAVAEVVVIDAAPGADHLAALIRSWTPHVTVVAATDVVALIGDGTTLSHVVLRDGSAVAAAAAFVKAPVVPRSSIARSLGCEVDVDGYIVTSDTGASTHPLVWAAGDVRRPPPMPHQVILAAADGSAAGIDIHKAFVAGRLSPSPQRSRSLT